ncbi:MAG: 2-amino-4-hydroxy-6-hydroxymethyldihydropteridine diphosphokinase [Pirellulales bacterium]|nr:2-amino-4-hydroxy-6-hydroxymethyldihydropteridine diphosphokinase [Pirellulales bacterium]
MGANLGDRAATLDAAVDRLGQLACTQLRLRSRWFDTRAVGGPEGQPGFLNGAAVIETKLAPEQVVRSLLDIESQFGRHRSGRWQPRELDLDLLLYDELVISRPELTVPHPWMAVRRFVLEPAAEVAPNLLHPSTGWSVARLLENLNTAHQYVAVASSDNALADRFAAELARRANANLLCLMPGLTDAQASGSSAREVALESVRRWAEQLAPERWPPAAAPRGGTWVVSNRWIGESFVDAHMAQAAHAPAPHRGLMSTEGIAASWSEITSRVVMPKLILRVERSHKSVSVGPTVPSADRAANLAAELARPGHGPVLQLCAADWDRAVDDGLAALAAAS